MGFPETDPEIWIHPKWFFGDIGSILGGQWEVVQGKGLIKQYQPELKPEFRDLWEVVQTVNNRLGITHHLPHRGSEVSSPHLVPTLEQSGLLWPGQTYLLAGTARHHKVQVLGDTGVSAPGRQEAGSLGPCPRLWRPCEDAPLVG